jgi:hypothetical protein
MAPAFIVGVLTYLLAMAVTNITSNDGVRHGMWLVTVVVEVLCILSVFLPFWPGRAV